MGCKSSKVKKPERDEAKELEEKERLEKEAQAKREAEEAAEKQAMEAAKAAEEAAKEEKEEEEAGPQEKVEEEVVAEPVEVPQDQPEPTPPLSEEPESIQPDEVGSVGTMSLGQEASSALYTRDENYVPPIAKITVASHAGAAILTARSVTPCDMTVVDQVAKYVSVQCGCDLGPVHDENMCPICRNMDLSDAPLLN